MWVTVSDCEEMHSYGEVDWRPGSGNSGHEHWVSEVDTKRAMEARQSCCSKCQAQIKELKDRIEHIRGLAMNMEKLTRSAI